MDFQIFKKQLQGSKLIRLKRFIPLEKTLGKQMFKMGLYDPFGYLKHKLWPKEGPKVKLPIFDSHPLKVKNCPDLLTCRWRVTYLQKVLDKGYTFALNLTSIGGLKRKLWASKVVGVPISKISGFPTWESQFREFQDSQLGNPETN